MQLAPYLFSLNKGLIPIMYFIICRLVQLNKLLVLELILYTYSILQHL